MTTHQKAYLRQNNALLAAYLEHFDSIADEVDNKGGRNEDYYLKQTAHRLKANVRSLRQVSFSRHPGNLSIFHLKALDNICLQAQI